MIKETKRIKKQGDSAKHPLALPAPPEEAELDPITGTLKLKSGKRTQLAITSGSMRKETPFAFGQQSNSYIDDNNIIGVTRALTSR